MWPKCIEQLTPFPQPLRDEPPDELADTLRQAGWADTLPVRLVALLGICTTDRYPDCPTLPEWHIENAEGEEDEYLAEIGRYFWCDFDLVDAQGNSTALRMTFNEGDADCNDGTWGVVWDRNTAEVVARLTSVGDCEGQVETVSSTHLHSFAPHSLPIPTDNDSFEKCRLPFTLVFAHDAQLEKLISVAMRWCLACSTRGG